MLSRDDDDIQSVHDEVMPADEGWWAAVLADEEVFASTQKESAHRAAAHASMAAVDWENIQRLFEQDEIVTLSVQGYNRGGLLVEDACLQGFVPVSHLVEMPGGLTEEERQGR